MADKPPLRGSRKWSGGNPPALRRFKTAAVTALRGLANNNRKVVNIVWGLMWMEFDQDMRQRVIIALDVPTRDQALSLVDRLHDHVGVFKVGMQLYHSVGPEIIKEINDLGGKVFVDQKFHDIPNTVAETVKVMVQRGAFMFTLHAGGGSRMMEAAEHSLREEAERLNVVKPISLGVTVLTSVNQHDFEQEMGVPKLIADHVVHLAKLAKDSGMDGVVCSPQEIKPIRKACGDDFLIVTPGVRPSWAATDDQARIMTPGEAIAAGASYLVIGRPVTRAADPVKAAKQIVAEMYEVPNRLQRRFEEV